MRDDRWAKDQDLGRNKAEVREEVYEVRNGSALSAASACKLA